ncbi:NACHT domain-containing protein [Actinoallomurus bryophytorum]|uniref:NACHT domain-containing protein n=1 Tax=Actinoallomurus bryophytorum TaxID=1490222 RepID=A0A543CD16_9ACTN|nr:NACHT domain-containing protein [Actinoallomurus bryophytorum]TQL94982.1 NACHT domain-containing protein [Actinoallomurus bryophytorum]
MALEAAAVAVGKALGKQLAQVWLAGRSAEQERGKDLVELIQTRFPDRIARRRFERQVADVADQVAERLLAMCGHEYGGLGENDKAAALAEVVQTLAEADLSDQALFAADLDPVRVAAQIRAGIRRWGEETNAARAIEMQLGEAGARLYEVVLDECCDCFVRIVRQLPQFGPRASTETLARLSGVSEQVELLLARLPVRTLDAPEGTATDEAFRRRYLEHISVTLDVLELFGVRVERYRPRTTLSVAYISLSVSTDEVSAGRGDRRSANKGTHLDEWRKGEHEPEESTLRVETALGRAPLTLIRGEAGSGKSTLLRWLAISAARGTFSGDLADWNGRVPFLVKLRSHAGHTLPPPERFLDGVADSIAGLMPAGWVHRRLQDGRVLLMVDGVDELPSAQRRGVRPWLAGLIAEYPDLRVVVTSRPAAAGADWLTAEGFATALLERMTPADIKELIRHWHDAVRDAGDLPCAPEQLPAFESALLARMESAPHLRALAGSPLLAAMLCALNLDREKQLPRDRMGLYAAALELLLERRDVERQIQADSELTLERAQKLRILQDFAWRLSITGRTELPKDAVVRRTAERLAATLGAPADAEAVLEHLLQRSGVLREPVPGRIDFVHRTVQEYLTAKQFADDGDLEPLIAQAHKDQWRETIIMAAGHANAPQREDLLNGLLARISAEPRNARRLKLLVAGCLETLPAIPAGLRADVEGCLDDLVPPRDLASARSLSNVGEPILDRLPRTPDGLTAATARAVVRTAWLVNGPGALELLTGYGADPRDEVQEELIRGWEYFDPDLYARKVLARRPPSVSHVTLPVPRLLSAIRHIKGLSSLHVADHPVSDLSFLYDLESPLESLRISGYLQSSDLTPLESCAESLEYLTIWTDSAVLDLAPIKRLRRLKRLILVTVGIDDIEFVRDLPELEILQLGTLTDVTDFSPLRTRTSIRTLGLNSCPALTGIGDLPPLDGLDRLTLTGSTLTSGLRELVERAPNLSGLHLTGSSWVDDLRPLATLRLDGLGLWGCRGIRDFSPLARLPELRFLDLEDTNIGDLSPIAEMANLETLWLRGCENVTDLAPLGGLRALKRLFIADLPPGIDLAPLEDNRRITVYIRGGQDVRNRDKLGRRVHVD